MIDLFSSEGDAALRQIASRSTLYGFDFDGTLSPIVPLPSDARIAPALVAHLVALHDLAAVAILTGRSADDLRQRLGMTPTWVIGNHGAEGLPPAADEANGTTNAITNDNVDADFGMYRAICARWRERLTAALLEHGADAGIFIEDKAHSLSVHYRLAGDRDAAERAIEKAIATLTPPPRLIGGKCVFNLLPDGAPDKGQALARLMAIEQCEAAFYIGDDETDEAVFYGAPDNWLTVRVGASDTSAARFFVQHQGEVASCLQRLVKMLKTCGPKNRRSASS